jgi:outer membrane protein OmpA-like peptidoglycan-associated protein
MHQLPIPWLRGQESQESIVKSIRVVLSVLLSLGLFTPAKAATHGPVDSRNVCLISSCDIAIAEYNTYTWFSTNSLNGLQNIELASDGKVWFAGPSVILGVPGAVGYIEPWNKDAGVHLCDIALLTHDGFTVEPYNLVPNDLGTMDVVGIYGGVVHYNSTCDTATYPTVQPANSIRAAARDVNGDIWAGYDGASKLLNLNTGIAISGTWTADMTSGPDDNMWAIDDAHNKVMTWDPNRAESSYQALPLNFCTPQSIASDRKRFLWVTCNATDVMVRVDTSAGHVGNFAYYNVPTGGAIGLPGVTVADDGVVWLTDEGDQAVKAFDAITTGTGGENLNFANFVGSNWGGFAPALRGITHDFDNNAWFIAAGNASINFIGINAVGPKPTDPTEPVEKTTKPTCSSPSQWTIYFANRSAKLSKTAKATLNCVVSKVSKAKSIKIYGYTMTNKKSQASKIANKKLAKKRAKAVRSYLRAKGVTAKIVVIAKGAVNPASKSNQSKNRRVVIVPKYQRMLSLT